MDLTIDRLTKQFGSKIAVDRVSTRLTPGVYGLLGRTARARPPSCAWCATCCAHVRRDTLRRPRRASARRRVPRPLGYLPQDFGYYPDFSALDFMCYLAALKVDRRAARRRSLELLAGGPCRRGAAEGAHVLGRHEAAPGHRAGRAERPGVLVLDEPTARPRPEGARAVPQPHRQLHRQRKTRSSSCPRTRRTSSTSPTRPPCVPALHRVRARRRTSSRR